MASIKQMNARTPKGLEPKQRTLIKPRCPVTGQLIEPGDGAWIWLQPNDEVDKRKANKHCSSNTNISIFVHESVVRALRQQRGGPWYYIHLSPVRRKLWDYLILHNLFFVDENLKQYRGD